LGATLDLPATVRISGLNFNIAVEDNEDFTDDLMGQYDHRRRLIRLSDRVTPEQQRATLLHEILHDIDQAVDADLTEHQVSSINRGLYAVLQDNPEVTAYLTR
jgi:predicted transcriptional regulator